MGSRDETVERLREALDREPDVLVAYLFGSVARGKTHPLSDTDVAVLLDKADLPRRRLELIGCVAKAMRSDHVDVVVLNDAPVSLAYRVVRDGIVLVSRDDVKRVRHEADIVSRYIDMEPFRRTLWEGLHHRIREGRFGRP